MVAIVWLIDTILSLYWWIVIVAVVLSWLYAFNVVNPSNQFVRMIDEFVTSLTEPALSRIRRFMPNLGAVDISPIVLLLAISFVQIFFRSSIVPRLL